MARALFAIFALLFVSAFATEKRSVLATTCDSVHTLDIINCASASEGPYCLLASEVNSNINGNICGCHLDFDCYSNPVYPWCNLETATGGVCDVCYAQTPATAVKATYVDDHLFCRNRFPSEFVLDVTPPDNFPNPTSEQVPPVAPTGAIGAFFREVCNRNANNGGACEPCSQASETNTPDETFPTYPTSFTAASLRGPKGSIHCRHVYPGNAHVTATAVPSTGEPRPICAYVNMFNDAGIGPASSPTSTVWAQTKVNLDIARACTTCDGTDFALAVQQRAPLGWQGACIPCFIGGIGRNALCALADAKNPICDTTSSGTAAGPLGCRPCGNNADCDVNAATCYSSGTCTAATIPATRGGNCMKDGSCFSCTKDSDCGVLDGGEKGNQPTCNTNTGQCQDLQPCLSNADCAAKAPGTNCMLDGTCRACTPGGTDCITNDGPLLTLAGATGKSHQPTCSSGICVDCAANSDCSGTGNANCQADGTCLNCGSTVLNNPNCGNADGGEKGTQPICDPTSNICIDACTQNGDCTSRGGSDAFTKGANCQADGTCHTCTSDNDCGSKDGPTISGQTTCQTTGSSAGQCYNPFTCSSNADCMNAVPAQPANCQSDKTCANCAVSKTSSNCGSADGGETPGQPNCNQNSRLCVAACTDPNNSDCAGTQGANCMKNGLCFDCSSDADCASTAAWQGDLGGNTVCINTICTPPCGSNAACPAGQNCNKDGRCAACGTNSDCVNNDGPPGLGSNTVCLNGVCVDPYTCDAIKDNAGCQANTGQKNCQADGSCLTCSTNSDCGSKDGGATPGQPKCQADGTCGPCKVNADCDQGTLNNCGADGFCYDCTAANERCGPGFDGGEIAGQIHCDSISHQCTNLCTADSQCEDECNPYCNTDTGCCVECTADSQCPYTHWRSEAALRVNCDPVANACIEPVTAPTNPFSTCQTDDDCGGNTPACAITEQKCVECLFDSHCSGSTPACSVSQQKCVECVFDDHCTTGDVCGSDHACHMSSAASLSVFGASLILAFTTLLAL